MTDFCVLLSRIQATYSLSEVADMLGCHRSQLHNIKSGIVPNFRTGLRILALHDEITGRQEANKAIDMARERIKVRLEGVSTKAEVVRRVNAQRARVGGKFVRAQA